MTAPIDRPAPLDGIRVIDLSRFIAGPLCCQILGDMGAEAIKVERPGGEDARRHIPFFNGESVYMMLYNRNKFGVTLDTRHPRARTILLDLIRDADVVVENYRPGTMDAMGLGYEALSEVNPRIILTSVSGFGQTGPNRDRALFDAIAQAETGLMSRTGRADDEPTLTGTFIADYIAGFHAAMGTLLALIERERSGLGQHVDVACFDALFATLSTHLPNYAMFGVENARTGSRDQITVPANVYPLLEGWVYIHAGTNPLFPKLAEAMGQPGLACEERFIDQTARLANADEIDRIVREWTGARDFATVAEALDRAGVPFGRVASIADAVESPQVAAREMMVDIEHPSVGTVKVPGIPIKMGATPGTIRKPPPVAGEDTDEVYARLLGLTSRELVRLRSEGAI